MYKIFEEIIGIYILSYWVNYYLFSSYLEKPFSQVFILLLPEATAITNFEVPSKLLLAYLHACILQRYIILLSYIVILT